MATVAWWILVGTFLCSIHYQESATIVLGFILTRSYLKV